MGIIGSRYLENLALIKHRLLSVQNGMPQEDPEFIIIQSEQAEEAGRCYYDKCPHKEEPSDSRVAILHGTPRRKGNLHSVYERAEVYPFHSACLEDLTKDQTVQTLN